MARYLAIILALFTSSEAAALYGEELPVEEASIVYIIDYSCSMGSEYQTYTNENGNSVDGYRMGRAKAEVAVRILDLDEYFATDLVVFDSVVTAANGELMPADDETAEETIGWLDSLSAAGSVDAAAAVAWALLNPAYETVDRFVVITDGAPRCYDDGTCDDPLEYADLIDEANTRGARIDVVLVAPDPEDDSPWIFGETVTGDSDGLLTVVD